MKLTATFLSLIILTSSTQAIAQPDNDLTVLQQFAQNLRSKNYDAARFSVSSDSETLFNKYTSYDLGDLTPGNISLLSKTSNKIYRYLKISGTNSQGRRGMVTVAMITENNQPKIALPESARLGFGPNWQQKVNMIEQSYLFARQNLGDQQSMQLLTTLLRK